MTTAEKKAAAAKKKAAKAAEKAAAKAAEETEAQAEETNDDDATGICSIGYPDGVEGPFVHVLKLASGRAVLSIQECSSVVISEKDADAIIATFETE